MKKLLYPLIFASLLLINTQVRAGERVLLLNDVSTNNLDSKLSSINVSGIKKICSYDYCDYIDMNNLKASLDTYVRKYIEKVDSEEERNTILVKGIKITKIILDKWQISVNKAK